jgi:hypothetical protein
MNQRQCPSCEMVRAFPREDREDRWNAPVSVRRGFRCENCDLVFDVKYKLCEQPEVSRGYRPGGLADRR